MYTAKNHKLLKTGLNNVVLPILFNVLNNIVQRCYTDCGLDSGSTISSVLLTTLNNEGAAHDCSSCFRHPSTNHNFSACSHLSEKNNINFDVYKDV